jgi:iron complex outermembrane receptor protein
MLSVCVGLLLSATPNAFAAAADTSSDASGDTLETVYVTARRALEKDIDVPISMTTLNAQTLDDNGVSNILNLTELIPSLQVISFNPRNTSIVIRGLGANVAVVNEGVESGTAVYVDGVLYARPAESTFDLPDVASIEELRGPQGTLYGKNSVAGVINVNTLMPTSTFQTRGTASLGDYGYQKLAGTVSGPIDDSGQLMARLSAYGTERDGFFKDVLTGQRLDDEHDEGARAQLLYQPSSDLSLRLVADYAHYKSSSPVQILTGVATTLADGQRVPYNFYQRAAAAHYTSLPFDPYARRTDINSPQLSEMEQGGASAHADWAVDDFTITSITAYRFWNWDPRNDDDLTALSVLTHTQQANYEREFSQELRVASPTDGPFAYSAGLYYFHETDDGFGVQQTGADAPVWLLGSSTLASQTALNGFRATAISTPHTASYAGYGQATWHIMPDLDLTGGFRFSHEDKTGGYIQRTSGPSLAGFSPVQQAAILALRASLASPETYSAATSDDLLGGLASLTYRVTDDINAYASYSHGEKSAGLNLANLAPGVPKVVAPESVDDYEVGFKSLLLNNRLALGADAFWTEDTNYQTTLFDLSNFATYLANIPAVRSRGFEADANANLFDGLTAHFSGAYTDAIYVSYPDAPAPFEDYTVTSAGKLNTNVMVNLSNRPLPAVSKWAFTLGGEYDRTLGLWGLDDFTGYMGVDESYRSRYFSTANLSIYSLVPDIAITNLRFGMRTSDNHWDLQFWARNLFDRKYFTAQAPIAFNSGAIAALLGDPRTLGVSLLMNF